MQASNNWWFLWPVAFSFAGAMLALVVALLFIYWFGAACGGRIEARLKHLTGAQVFYAEKLIKEGSEKLESWKELLPRLVERIRQPVYAETCRTVGITFGGQWVQTDPNIKDPGAIVIGNRIDIPRNGEAKLVMNAQRAVQLKRIHITNGDSVWCRMAGVGQTVLFASAEWIPLNDMVFSELLPLTLKPGATLWFDLEWRP